MKWVGGLPMVLCVICTQKSLKIGDHDYSLSDISIHACMDGVDLLGIVVQLS